VLSRRTFLQAGAAATAALGRTETSPIGKTPHTRFSVNVEMWWRDLPFLERIDRAAALGFPAIEFWEWHEKDVDAIAGKVRSLGLSVSNLTGWGFDPGLNDPRNHDDFVRAVESGCAVARKLGASLMTIVGGDDQPGMTQEEMHENIVEGLKRAAPIAERNDVVLALEPMNVRVDHAGHCLYGSPPAVRICERVGSSHVKLNWDLYHMQISEGDLCGHLREGFPYIGYVQLADTPGRNEPGTGEVHYNRVLRELHELGYRGYVGLECRPSGDEIEAARRVAAADVW
jgi:hydroxypyruvate isomerase